VYLEYDFSNLLDDLIALGSSSGDTDTGRVDAVARVSTFKRTGVNAPEVMKRLDLLDRSSARQLQRERGPRLGNVLGLEMSDKNPSVLEIVSPPENVGCIEDRLATRQGGFTQCIASNHRLQTE